jgi:hypothetical protein
MWGIGMLDENGSEIEEVTSTTAYRGIEKGQPDYFTEFLWEQGNRGPYSFKKNA